MKVTSIPASPGPLLPRSCLSDIVTISHLERVPGMQTEPHFE